MSKTLFSDFDSVSSKEWKQKIQADLRGADYNDTLIWQSPEGIHVKPFYHADEFEEPFTPVPGHPDSWEIVQRVFIDSVDVARSLASSALSRGADSLWLKADKKFDIASFFKDLDLGSASLYFDLGFLSEPFYTELSNHLKDHPGSVHFNVDLISHLSTEGNWYYSKEKDHEIQENLLSTAPTGHLLGVNGSVYQNAGANIVQELAYTLCHATEYLQHFQQTNGLKLTFNMAIGANYFFEIAKFRALRKLYAAVATEFNADPVCHILAVPSSRNKTLYDYNMNMLRTTTECMSALIGGVNAISNLPYDHLYHKSNEFGERISRNQLLILRSESYFDQVANPGDGSYYIESLTDQLAEKALALFKEIEENGGLVKQLFQGTIQRKIRESAARAEELFENKERILVGTNEFQNPEDRMKDNLELYPFLKKQPRKTLFEPIKLRRISENTEKERLKNEEN